MADSAHLKLPYIDANQAQKHVTHNEAVRLLDALVQMSVKSRTLTAPPGSPADGDRYIVAAGATGAWATWDLNIAYYVDGAWMKLVPQQGWLAWIEAEAAHLRWDGTAWGGLSSSGSVAWGAITGTLSNQTDLQAALDGKAATSHTHTASQISDSTAAGRSMLTAADAAAQTALLNAFASGLKGLAPPSGGGTTNFLRADGTWAAPPGGGGSGDVVGPASATDNAIARFDGATGKLIQNSGATIDDNGKLSLPVVSAASAPLNIGDGSTTPTTPVNGDLWTNGGYIRYRSGGAGYALAPLSIANSWTAKQTFATPTASIPSINLPHGVAPATPANGDVWSTTSGLFMRVNAATVQFSIAGHTHATADISDSTAAGRSMLTAADAAAQTALLNTFTSALKGLAPASGGGTANFLRADGTWAAPPAPTQLQNLTLLGVNATADATNKLAVASSAILFNNIGNGVQVKVNKTAATDTASFLFQTNFSGRAEFGTTGDDDFHFKVSADGSAWTEAILINRTTGIVTLTNNSVGNAALADMATNRFKGRTTAGTGDPEDLTATQATAILNTMVGDGGSGGTKGLVPAPAAGDAVAGKFLKADGTWAAPSGGGGSGDVVGPASATDNAIARFDTATGKLIQNSAVLLPDGGEITLPYVATPAVPAADKLNLFAGRKANRMLPRFIGPSGLDVTLQPLVGSNKIAWWNPPGNATTVPGVLGIAAPTAVGTATARNVAATSMATRSRRLGYVSAATAGSLSGHYATTAQFTIGALGGIGGFFYVCRFVVSDAAAVSGARMFVGLRNAVAAPTNIEPSSGQTNMVGVAQLSTSNNLHIVYGGSTAQTAIDLGASFPANTLSADLYELALFAPPDTQVVYYQVTRMNTGDVATGTLSGAVGTVIPAATIFLAHTAWRCNNATALAVGIDVVSLYIETDN